MLRFSKSELARYSGQNGAATLIAYKGKVYNVSESFLWQNGRHQARHMAGMDLTAFLDQAPHGEDVLERFPVIGILMEDG